MKKKKGKNGRIRMNFRFPTDLAGWAKDYADKKGTNVTQLIIDYFVSLRDQEKPNASQ